MLSSSLWLWAALAQAPDPTATRTPPPKPAEVVVEAAAPPHGEVQLPEPDAVHRGHDLYQRYCQSCHGPFGDGRGDSADFLAAHPRDFTRGTYKFRSTPSGTLPVDADLFRSIKEGIWGSGMPAWSGVSDGEVWDLVAYLESFSARFYQEPRGVPLAVAPEPEVTPQGIANGKRLYDDMGCANCHGVDGRGDGPSARDLRDEPGFPIRPLSFVDGHWKAGKGNASLYRDLMTGLDGTPMASFAEALKPQQAWDLVHFLRTLAVKGGWRAGDSPGDRGQFDAKAP